VICFNATLGQRRLAGSIAAGQAALADISGPG